MTTSTRPHAGTRAATVHQQVFRLRRAIVDPIVPGQVLPLIRAMSEDGAKACLAVALASESWTPAERAAMALPPQPDHAAIEAENMRLRDEYRRRTTAAQDTEVTFMEDAA